MTERNSLHHKGYDPQTKNQGMGWQCDIAVNGAIKSFRARAEREAMQCVGAPRH